MKRYKVQWAYAHQIGSPSFHNQEPAARGEVAYLLGTWIRRRLVDYVARLEQYPRGHEEFRESLKYVLNEVDRLMAQGQVWEAFDLWEEFYARFENEFDYPLFVGIGTVIVEGLVRRASRTVCPC